MAHWFLELYEKTGWNFSVFYDAWEAGKFARGVVMTVELSLGGLLGSTLVALVCVVARSSGPRPLAWLFAAYVEFFRNTPGLAQLYFLFFGLGSYFGLSTPGPSGQPAITPEQFAVLALSLQYGAFGSEIIRAGLEAVPRTTLEATQALGYGRLHALTAVMLPLALRHALPALGNNMVQVVKATATAYAIAVPETLYVASGIWTERANVVEMMNVVLVTYLGLMAVLTLIVKLVERSLRIPGFGQ